MRKVHPLVTRLIELRKECGLSQANVARAVGIDRTSLLRVEKGERALHADEAVAWALACGGELVLVGRGADALATLSVEERQIVECYRKTSVEARHVMLRFCEELPHFNEVARTVFLAQLDALAGALREVSKTG